MIYCVCSSRSDTDWPTISMLIGDNVSKFWVYLDGQDYVLYHSHRYSYRCSIMIMDDTTSTKDKANWRMGAPFLRAYYSVYDLENRRLGLLKVPERYRNGELPVHQNETEVTEE